MGTVGDGAAREVLKTGWWWSWLCGLWYGGSEYCTILCDSVVVGGTEGGVVGRVDSIVRGNGGGSAPVGAVGVTMMW